MAELRHGAQPLVIVRLSATNLFSAFAVAYTAFALHGRTVASIRVRHERDDGFLVLVTLRGTKAEAVRAQILRRLPPEADPRLPDW